jgi:uncharacterized protein (TIGR00730 family)
MPASRRRNGATALRYRCGIVEDTAERVWSSCGVEVETSVEEDAEGISMSQYDQDEDLQLRDSLELDDNPSWRIFRIMSEFVDGFTFLAGIDKSVTFFGSARLDESHPYYQLARELGRRLASHGFTIVTGGGPGVMQAANQGACDADGKSVGLNIQLPHEQRMNPYVRESMSFHYFFSRKVMLDFSAEAYIFFPGGFGTMDEFFELVTLRQTGKMDPMVPVILIGRDYWEPLLAWMEETLLRKYHTIAEQDLKIWTLTDDLEEAAQLVEASMARQREQRLNMKGRTTKTADDKLQQATLPMKETEQ